MKYAILLILLIWCGTSALFSDINTDLIHSAKNGDLDQVKALVEKGANINMQDSIYGWTPLFWASFGNYTNVVKFLISKDADIGIKDNSGDTVLDMAKKNSLKQVYELIASLAVIDVNDNIPTGKGYFSTDSIGIFIGNSSYENGIPNVDFAASDAEMVRKYMIQTFGLTGDNTMLLKNLTKGSMEALFGNDSDYTRSRLYRLVNTGKFDVVIYYSGHGAPDTKNLTGGKGYLVPVDADVASIDITGFAVDTLLNNLKKMKQDGVLGKVWVIFDSCFSGDSGGGMLLKNISPVGIKVSNPLLSLEDSLMVCRIKSSALPQKKQTRHLGEGDGKIVINYHHGTGTAG